MAPVGASADTLPQGLEKPLEISSARQSHASIVKIPRAENHEINLINASLHEEEDDNGEAWETMDLNAEEDLDSNDSLERNPYKQQLVGVIADDLPPNYIKEVILGLPVPTPFQENF